MTTLEKMTNLAKLPAYCYALIACREPGDRIVLVTKGVPGFSLTEFDDPDVDLTIAVRLVELLNHRLGVTAAQKLAMVAGAMEGFDSLVADPDLYTPRFH